jgi:hypothetical protein
MPGGTAQSPNLQVDDSDTGGPALNAELVAHLALLDPSVNPCVSVAGSVAAGDKGGGTFDKVAIAGYTIDNALVFASANAAFYWRRRYSGAVDLGWWGGKLDNVTNDRPALVLLAASFAAPGAYCTLRIDGQCSVATDYTIPANILVRFDGNGEFVGAGHVTFTSWQGSSRGYGSLYHTQYVDSTNGNDYNDGLTPGRARKTVCAAHDAIAAGRGHIKLIGDCYTGGEVAGQGLRLMYVGDPQYGAAGYPGGVNPTLNGWRGSKFVTFEGAGPNAQQLPGLVAGAKLLLGNPGDAPILGAVEPSLWISGSTIAMRFTNMELEARYRSIRLGVPSNLAAPALAHGAVNLTFDRVYAALYGAAGTVITGPGIEAWYSFWIKFQDCTFASLGHTAAIGGGGFTAAQRGAAIYANYCWLFRVERSVCAGGGGVYCDMGAGGNINIDDLLVEGDFVSTERPLVYFAGGIYSHAELKDVAPADMVCPVVVEVTPAVLPPEQVVCRNCGVIDGPATILHPTGGYGFNNETVNYASRRQVGVGLGYAPVLDGPHDGAGSVGAPACAPLENLVTVSAPASNATVTVTTGITDKHGATSAWQAATVEATVQDVIIHTRTGAVALGDYVIACAWVRAPSGAGTPAAGALNLLTASFSNAGYHFDTTVSYFYLRPPIIGDGEWHLLRQWGKVIAVDAGATTLSLSARCITGHAIQVKDATLHYIPAASLAQNEVSLLARHCQPLPPSAAAATLNPPSGTTLNAPLLTQPSGGTATLANFGQRAGSTFGACGNTPLVQQVLPLVPTVANVGDLLKLIGLARAVLPASNADLINSGWHGFSSPVTDGELWWFNEASPYVGLINGYDLAPVAAPDEIQAFPDPADMKSVSFDTNGQDLITGANAECDFGTASFTISMLVCGRDPFVDPGGGFCVLACKYPAADQPNVYIEATAANVTLHLGDAVGNQSFGFACDIFDDAAHLITFSVQYGGTAPNRNVYFYHNSDVTPAGQAITVPVGTLSVADKFRIGGITPRFDTMQFNGAVAWALVEIGYAEPRTGHDQVVADCGL